MRDRAIDARGARTRATKLSRRDATGIERESLDDDARRGARRRDRDARGLTDDDASQRTYATASAKGASGADVKVREKFLNAWGEDEGRDGEARAREGVDRARRLTLGRGRNDAGAFATIRDERTVRHGVVRRGDEGWVFGRG